MIRGQQGLDWASQQLKDAMLNRMHGSVIVSFQDGAITAARTEAVKKPPVDNAPKSP